MKIKNVKLKNFMMFNSLDIEFSPNINIISGENSTGKTPLIKVLYATTKSLYEWQKGKTDFTKDSFEQILVSKLNGVFKPDDDKIGRLVGRQQGSNRADLNIIFDNDKNVEYGFGNRTRSKDMIMKRIQDKIKEKLKWLNCNVRVVDYNTHGNRYFITEYVHISG